MRPTRGRGAIAIVAATVIGVAACRRTGRDPRASAGVGSGAATGQSSRDALAILCGRGPAPPDVATLAPADRAREVGNWLDRTITDPSTRALIATLADGHDPATRVARAAFDAGLTACQPLALFGPREVAGAAVPDVAAMAAGTIELDQELPIVAITSGGAVIDGRPVPAGEVAAAVAALGARSDAAAGELVIAADRTLRFAALGDALAGARQGGARRVLIAVGLATGATRAVPLELARPSGARAPLAALVVGVDAITGRAGARSIAVPATPQVAVRDGLAAALGGAIAARPSGGGTVDRAELALAPAVTVQAVAEVIAAARAAPDGTPLCAAVELAAPP